MQVPTILLTNDADNRSKALREGLQSLGVMAYCRTHHAEVGICVFYTCTCMCASTYICVCMGLWVGVTGTGKGQSDPGFTLPKTPCGVHRGA